MSDILELPRDAGSTGTLHAGWDFFTADPGTREEMRCRVCGEVMAVHRGVVGPTSWAHAMAIAAGVSQGKPHDSFACDLGGEAWHRQALALKREAERTPSGELAVLLLAEADRLVRLRTATKEV